MDVAILVGTYLVLASAGVYAYVRTVRRREEILRDIAEARGGVVEPGRWGNDAVLIIVTDGVEVRVTMPNRLRTAWIAHVASTVGFSITPARRGMRSEQVRLPGSDQLAQQFLVTADDPPLLRGIWRESFTNMMLEHFPDASLRCDGETITLDRPGEYQSQFEVERGIDFLLALGRADVFGLAALRKLPDATLRDRAAERPMVSIAGPEDIEVGPAREHKRTYTIARARSVELADAVSASVVDGRIVSDAGIPEHARGALKRLGTAQVALRDGAVEIRWPTVERKPDRLQAAIDLLRALARGRQENVFR